MIELGLLLLGVIGGIFIGYGWGRIAEREARLRHNATWYKMPNDPSDEVGA